jgi:hypothetical protein
MQAIAAAKRAQQSNKDPHIMAPLFAAIRELRKFQNTRKKVVCVFPEPIPASQVVAIQMAAISTKSAVPCRRRHSLHGNRGNTSGMQLRFPLV